VSKSERRAAIKKYQKARLACAEIHIPAATVPSQVLQGAVVSHQVLRFPFASETALDRQPIAGPVVFVGAQFHPRPSLVVPLGTCP
jgi:hypothetical protein